MNDDVQIYIKESLTLGKNRKEIALSLQNAGWQPDRIEEAFATLEISNKDLRKAKSFRYLTFAIVAVVLVLLLGTTLYLWRDRLNVTREIDARDRSFYAQLARANTAFTDAGELIFPNEHIFSSRLDEYLTSGIRFISVDLNSMKISLYENGKTLRTMPVLSKGRDGSWWETPTGEYRVLGKSANAYSTIGNVWMPYSIQFYGNYFIHGWPHYDDGTPVPQGYSGGCIRLANEDARAVYEFAGTNIPILVLENKTSKIAETQEIRLQNATLPPIRARSFLVADLSSGKIIVEKMAGETAYIGSMAKLMTGLVAHEVVYLGKYIRVSPSIMAGVGSLFTPNIGQRYIGLDLLYPLLMQSSDDAARILASFIGEPLFLENMRRKAVSLSMHETAFVDVTGNKNESISTAYDILKLLEYVWHKRPFLFDISKGVAFENVGILRIGDTIPIANLKNTNAFTTEPNLLGVTHSSDIKPDSMATVWNISGSNGTTPIAIIILNSENATTDSKNLYEWLHANVVIN